MLAIPLGAAGLPWQELALAWTAYRRAQATGLGHEFNFLA